MSLPILRASIEQIVEYRDRALSLAVEAHDIRMQAEQKEAESGAFLTLACYRLTEEEKATGWTPPSPMTEEELDAAREDFRKGKARHLDKGIWQHLVEATKLERLMDRTARAELREQLADVDGWPEVTVENVYATIEGFEARSYEIFQRGIANVFSSLDRRFRSHDGFKIGNRIVLNNALVDGHWCYHKRQDEALRDVERTFYTLDGREHPERAAGVIPDIDAVKGGMFDRRQFEIENDYFRVRGFKNGNLHLWFTRKDLVRKINRILADYYGETIGESPDVADPDEMGPGYHVTPAKDFGFFETDEKTALRLLQIAGRDGLDAFQGCSVLEPSAGRGALADIARQRGGAVTCVEIQGENCAVLRHKGHRTIQADFLKLGRADLPMFDVILMNPPFDRGRDCDHITHAVQFLKPGGLLIAITSARIEYADDRRHRAFHKMLERMVNPNRWSGEKWSDLPPGSFAHAGTNVNTRALVFFKPAEEARAAA